MSLAYASAQQSKPFPEHWGDPPKIQTRDNVEWPDGYGRGSSTVSHWIKANLDKDRAADKPGTSVVYSTDFSTVQVGELPEDFLVLNGGFTVREENGSRFMELPGTPLESFAVMFGPAGRENVEVSARILGTSKGRRHPAFAIGLNGLGGYRLKVIPARRTLELSRGPEDAGESVASAPSSWKSGAWVHLRLRIRATGEGSWRVEGKEWMEGSPEPTDWTVSHVTKEKPLPGRPFVAASPYAGIPIRFDDLAVTRVED